MLSYTKEHSTPDNLQRHERQRKQGQGPESVILPEETPFAQGQGNRGPKKKKSLNSKAQPLSNQKMR